jgi:hypothetical protein
VLYGIIYFLLSPLPLLYVLKSYKWPVISGPSFCDCYALTTCNYSLLCSFTNFTNCSNFPLFTEFCPIKCLQEYFSSNLTSWKWLSPANWDTLHRKLLPLKSAAHKLNQIITEYGLIKSVQKIKSMAFKPLNPELNPICYLLALLAHHFLHVSRIRVKSLTTRLLMSYIYIYIWSTYSWCF